jgi:phosphatidylglycerol:prolipoprotein diacylglycerol transferase
MRPVIFTIPGIDWAVPGYGLMLMLGLFVAIWWAARRALKSGGSPDVILNCGFIAIIGGVVGARAMYVIHYWDQFRTHGNFLQVAWSVIDVSKGGLEYYGGFILTTLAALAWLRWWEKVSIRWYMDIIAPSVALGLAFGRVGCFLNGCCFGGTCDLPWAVRFPFGSSACVHQWKERLPGGEIRAELLYTDATTGVVMPLTRELLSTPPEKVEAVAKIWREMHACKDQLDTVSDPEEKQRLQTRVRELVAAGGKNLIRYGPACENMKKYGLSAAGLRALAEPYRTLPVHPTQPYTTITALLIALFLNALYWRRTRDGQVICTLLVLQPVARWLLEVIRADNPIDTIGVFTISQFLALCMMLVGVLGLLLLQRMPPRSPRARLWEPPEEDSQQKAGKKKAPEPAG